MTSLQEFLFSRVPAKVTTNVNTARGGGVSLDGTHCLRFQKCRNEDELLEFSIDQIALTKTAEGDERPYLQGISTSIGPQQATLVDHLKWP